MNRIRFSLAAGAIVALATALSLTTPATGDQPGSESSMSAGNKRRRGADLRLLAGTDSGRRSLRRRLRPASPR